MKSPIAMCTLWSLCALLMGCGGGGGGDKMHVAMLENKSGAYVHADTSSAQAALASVTMPEDLVAWMPDPTPKEAYPIVTYTWLLCAKNYPDKKAAETMRKVVDFCLTTGQKSSEPLGYVPLPDDVVSKVKAAAEKITGKEDKAGDTVRLQGAGASFPAPLYMKWFKDFKQANKGVNIDYQSVGSGAGIKSFIDGTVDFGASDAAMSEEEIKKVPADKGVVVLPMTAGSIVLAYNLDGIKDLKLSRDAYLGIFLGKVTKWNDETIAKANPGVKLPDKTIHVIVRSDSSGTTYVFTKHLAAVSPDFAKSPGVNKLPSWPVGTKAKGNEGITAAIKTTPGAIGYIEYSFAKSK